MVMNEWLEENMMKGLIQQSLSPFTTRCILENKPNRGLQFCTDYQDINSKTVNNRYPFPQIREIFNPLVSGRIYTKLDDQGVYKLVRVQKGRNISWPSGQDMRCLNLS